MKYLNLKENYPELHEHIDTELRKLVGPKINSSLEYLHAKLFSSIIFQGYWDILTKYRLHIFAPQGLLAVLLITAKGNKLPNIITDARKLEGII